MGKGYYDRFLGKFVKLNYKIETIGIAFSFQNIENYRLQSTISV